MFNFIDGKTKFYQWDTKQRLQVADASIEQVHFCNRTDDCALKREVYNEGGKRLVNVPDILLQDAWRLHVYAWDGKETKHEDIFGVEPRTKPINYVYTEEEITNYEALEKRIDQIEENGVSDEKVAEAISDYLEENPIEAGATEQQAAQIEANKAAISVIEQNYASKEYVDNAVDNVDVDLTDYATKKYVDSSIANAQLGGGETNIDLSDYATKTYVDDAVAAVPTTDLTGYATEDYVDDAVSNAQLGGGGSAKKLVISFEQYFTGATFSMPLEDIVKMTQEELDTYDIVGFLPGGTRLYVADTGITDTDIYIRMFKLFISTAGNIQTELRNVTIDIVKSNQEVYIDSNSYENIESLPIPTSQKKYLVAENGYYSLEDPAEETNNENIGITLADVDGTLTVIDDAYQGITPEMLLGSQNISKLLDMALFVVNETTMIADYYKLSSINMEQFTIDFSNGTDKMIHMAADGAFTYVALFSNGEEVSY